MVRRTALSLLMGGWFAPRLLAEDDYKISTTARLVLLDVSVKDAKGGFASGLTQEQFKIYENGKLQSITEFANSDIPVTVGLVIDESGSMRRKRPEVVTAALSFVTSSNRQDEVFVLHFNESVYAGLPESAPFSDDIKKLRTALWLRPAEGRTALYDAILRGLQYLAKGRRDKKTLILISDGGDNVSAHNWKEVERAVLEDIATIYTIGIFDQDDPDRNPDMLRKLAHISGGEAFFPKVLEEIVPICEQIAKEIRTRYTIGYVPSADNGKGLRHIRVMASDAGRGKLLARTRTAYLYGEEGSA
jgi:Ca-activated chloride channel family protein